MNLTDTHACFQHAPAYCVCDGVFSWTILYIILIKQYFYLMSLSYYYVYNN